MSLLDHRGRPISAGPKGVRQLADIEGVSRSEDGSVTLTPAAMAQIRNHRYRRVAMSKVPSIPRHMMREGGGVGVSKHSQQHAGITLASLRTLRERSPIVQIIHSARHYQVRRLAQRWTGKQGDVGFRVVHKDYTDQNAKQPDGFDRYIRQFETLLYKPAPSYGVNSLKSLMALLEEDLLTINRPVLEPIYSAFNDKRIVQMRPVDGALVWPTLLYLEKWQQDTPEWGSAYVEDLTIEDQLHIASEALQHDLAGATYCLVRDGVLERCYHHNELVVAPIQNRTDIRQAGYWPSHVEQAIELISAFVHTFDYNNNFFTKGMMAEMAFGVSGDLHPTDLDAIRDMMREATQGVDRAFQPPFIPLPVDGAITPIQLKQNNRDMMFETWFSFLSTATAAGVYRMDPSAIGIKPWDGSGGSSLNEPSRAAEIALAKEEGLQGDIGHLVEEVLDPMAIRCHPDLRVLVEYGDFDPQRQAQIYEVRARVDMTRNEVRLTYGDPPMGFWVPTDEVEDLSDEDRAKYDGNLWNMPADSGFVNAMEQRRQMDAFGQQEGAPGAPDDGFGGQEDPEGEEDGFGGAAPRFPYGRLGGSDPGQAPQPPQAAAPPSPQTAPMQKGTRITIFRS